MEISGKVLREVEFRDRLRGYDTDEVDEFLEKVATAIDELYAELAALKDRAERAEEASSEVVIPDDESIARTLVLAQRTADLAIKEANEQAERMLTEARERAKITIEEAERHANQLRTEAERGIAERVANLTAERDQIEREVTSLTGLITSERERLCSALNSLIGVVSGTLAVNGEVAEVAKRERPAREEEAFEEPSPRLQSPAEPDEEGDLFVGRDLEQELQEDADAALFDRSTRPGEPIEPGDSDEDLWARWASSGEQGSDRFSFGSDDENFPA